MSKYRKAFLIWLAIVTAICGTVVVLHHVRNVPSVRGWVSQGTPSLLPALVWA
jgi:hypothetical protein